MKVTSFLAATLVVAASSRTAWVFESELYANNVRAALASSWAVEHCDGSPNTCGGNGVEDVEVVIGRADSYNLSTLPSLKLTQSPSYFHTDGDRVPLHSAIASFDDWPAFGNEEIAEFVIAAIFQHVYRLPDRATRFRSCAWSQSAAADCASASELTTHAMVSDLTVGVLGYGRIGQQVAKRAAALGATVVATALHVNTSQPTPAPLTWLSSDNDKLYRAADVVVVTVPGSVVGLVNATSLGLIRDGGVLIPVSAGPIDFADLHAALVARPALSAVLDVWPQGCWHYPNVSCGAPLGDLNWPSHGAFASLPNVLPLPGVAMRDSRFWAASARAVAANLDAIESGAPLRGIVRNASSVPVPPRRRLERKGKHRGGGAAPVPIPSPSPPADGGLGDSGFTMSEINP